MSLVVVGSVAFDSVKSPFGEVENALGGSATYFSTAASFFTDVKLVAVVGEDFPEGELDELRSRGVDLQGLVRAPGKTFRWSGVYSGDMNEAVTLDTQLNVFSDFEPDLPESYRDADYLFLANIEPSLQLKVLDQVRSPKLIAADTMNFWIDGSLDVLKEMLARIDLIFVNDAEVRSLSGETNIARAVRKVQAMGPSRVVVKRGEHGALLFDGDAVFAAPAYPLESVFDPTGAGDSFGGGFMGWVSRRDSLDRNTLRQAAIMGSVMASYNVERFSLERLRELDARLIEQRFEMFEALTSFARLEPLGL